MRSLILKYPLASFVVFAHGISWCLWLPSVVAWKLGSGTDDVPGWVSSAAVLGAYGPATAAIVVTGVVGGRTAVGGLLRKLLIWRVGFRWYLVVLGAPPAVLAVALWLYALQGHSLGRFDPGQWLPMLGLPLLALPFGPLGEELGWRGLAQPALQRRYTALTSSLILGTLWTFWHAPAFWAPSGTLISGRPVTLASVAFYLVFTIGLTVLMTWVVNNTRGSVLLAVVFHAMYSGVLFPLFPDLSEQAIDHITRLNVYPIWAVAGLVLVLFGAQRLTRRPAAPAQSAGPPPRLPWRVETAEETS